ncbi:MAG: peptidoglycan editing factor PgeF [Thermodesulfobacteriota bacterium]|nr:peptidoglycan editing factor PgeF [Thermodesulfobacteriota bacterium]
MTDGDMIQTTQNGLTFFQFSHLARYPGVLHGIFARTGGVSGPPFDSLNMSTSVGDTPEAVKQNRKAVAACFGNRPLFFLNQVHKTGVHVVVDAAAPAAKQPDGDALVTADPGLLLGIKLADCQAVLLYDPVKNVAANIHSGWRGSVADIIGITIKTLTQRFGVNPGDMLAGIGPSLGPCCAEFVNYKNELPPPFWKYKDKSNRFDFWQISRHQLMAAGVPEAHIEIAGLCTRCRTDLFFSYRGEGRTGRFAAVIGMPDKTLK